MGLIVPGATFPEENSLKMIKIQGRKGDALGKLMGFKSLIIFIQWIWAALSSWKMESAL